MAEQHAISAFEWLGRQPYGPMWQRLQNRAVRVSQSGGDEVIWACEHDPIYTTGRRGVDNRSSESLPAPLLVTDRGGETTFHGPGQILLYPIVNLRSRAMGVKTYVHLLEQSCIDLLTGFGLQARRRCGFPGVWLDQGKVAALGVRVARGVASHGMALNVAVDPAWFSSIHPCGLSMPVVNLSSFGVSPALPELAEDWYHCLAVLLAGQASV